MFEKFNVQGLGVANQAFLTLVASEMNDGVVIDCGDGVTTIVPIQEGISVKEAMKRFEVGGRDISNYLAELLTEAVGGNKLDGVENYRQHAVLSGMKEQLCYVALDYDKEIGKGSELEKEFELPDGQKITISNERTQCAEALFNTQLIRRIGLYDGIHKAASASLKECDENFRELLCPNIVLSGGTTLLPGFMERMRKELAALGLECTFHVPQERKHAAWLGGSKLADLLIFDQMCITKEDYENMGASIVHKKCPLHHPHLPLS